MPGRGFEKNMGASEVVYYGQAVPQKQPENSELEGKENEPSINKY